MKYKIINGAVSFGADTILEEINFEINNKEKVAIIGRNGCGKSTFLNVLINNELMEEGIGEDKFAVYKESLNEIGFLKQVHFDDEDITLLDEVLKVYKEITDLEKLQSRLVEEMNIASTEELVRKYSKALDRYEFLGGYTYKKEYETAIKMFGFSEEDKNKKLNEFSGGQRTKIAFIKLLLSKPDLLLLDEPTNHLDINAIEWLEGYIKSYPKAVVIVSHDRMFINKVVDKIYEIEYGVMIEYSGDYEFFEKQKKINYERSLKDYEFQQKEIKRLSAVVERFRYKATKAKMAQSKLKQIERMNKLTEPNRYDLDSFKTNFKVNQKSGNDVISIKDLEIGYEENVFLSKVNFELKKGDMLGIIGSNGTGKSTFLKTLVGKQKKLGGSISFGTNVDIGYFDQQMEELDDNKTVIDEFYDKFPDLTITEVRNSLAAFMFYGDDVFKEIKTLSGGEKVRLSLSMILKKGPNLLILDEPTNHVDMIGKESLENLLKNYEGTIIVVSHDRYFINKISNKILVFNEDKTTDFYQYGYEYYLEKRKVENEEDTNNKNLENIIPKKVYSNPLKEKQKIERKIEKIELKISECEEKISELKRKLDLEEVYTDYIKLQEIQTEIDKIEEYLNDLLNQWDAMQEELEEILKINCKKEV